MSTQAQNGANRRNAKKSTGPRSAAGKERSRLNAVKSGLASLSGVVLLPTEDPGEFDAFRDAFLVDLDPVGVVEEDLAMQVIECSWRLRRAPKIERGVLAHGVADADERFFTGLKRMLEITERDARLAAAGIRDPEMVTRIVDEELHAHLEGLLDVALRPKRKDEARLASGFIEDAAGANALAKLSRYETAQFNRRNQALAMLREFQAARSEDRAESE